MGPRENVECVPREYIPVRGAGGLQLQQDRWERMRRRCLVCLLGDKKARIDQSIFKGLIWIIVLILKFKRNIFISYDIACSHL